MEALTCTRIKNNSSGNPRVVVHFLNLNTRAELDAIPWIGISEKYALAIQRANRINGRKYHTRGYGGGIVFQESSLTDLAAAVSRVTGRLFSAE